VSWRWENSYNSTACGSAKRCAVRQLPRRARAISASSCGQGRALGRQRPHQFVAVARARAEGPERYDLRLPLRRHLRARDRFFVNIQADEKCASLCYG